SRDWSSDVCSSDLARKLGDPRGPVAPAGLHRHRLADDSAEPLEVDDAVELEAVAGGAGGEDDWIGEAGAEKCPAERGLAHLMGPVGVPGRPPAGGRAGVRRAGIETVPVAAAKAPSESSSARSSEYCALSATT